MKKVLSLTFAFSVMALGSVFAEDVPATEPVPVETPAAPAAETPVAPAPVDIPAPIVEAPVAVEPTPAPLAETIETATDNLEFISGEITAMDEAAKTVTVKMYGETADNEADKMLTVTVDASTDITDGEQDRELKSLAAGTEVDVEYDPATKKATYIFVY